MKKKILATVDDLVGSFLYYDRKEDEELSIDQLNEAIETGEITIDEIVSAFRKGLEAQYADRI
jgi:plasmid maintenance system antidote protein VapI